MKVQKQVTVDIEVVEWAKKQGLNLSGWLNELAVSDMAIKLNGSVSNEDRAYILKMDINKKTAELDEISKRITDKEKAMKEAEEREKQKAINEANKIIDLVESAPEVADEFRDLVSNDPSVLNNVDIIVKFVDLFRAKGVRLGMTTLKEYAVIKSFYIPKKEGVD